jgi:hypothetical protein
LGPAERGALAAKARAVVAELADQDRNLARVEELYRGLASGKRGSALCGRDAAARP